MCCRLRFHAPFPRLQVGHKTVDKIPEIQTVSTAPSAKGHVDGDRQINYEEFAPVQPCKALNFNGSLRISIQIGVFLRHFRPSVSRCCGCLATSSARRPRRGWLRARLLGASMVVVLVEVLTYLQAANFSQRIVFVVALTVISWLYMLYILDQYHFFHQVFDNFQEMISTTQCSLSLG